MPFTGKYSINNAKNNCKRNKFLSANLFKKILMKTD